MLLGGLPRSTLVQEAATPALAAALSAWREQDLLLEYVDGHQLQSASRLQQLFHRGGWSGAISLLESMGSGDVGWSWRNSGKPAGPPIPVRATTSTPGAGPAPAVERALRMVPRHWSATIQPVTPLPAPDDGSVKDAAAVVSNGDIQRWMPVLHRSGLRIGHIILLTHDGPLETSGDLVYRQLATGFVVRDIEAELQSDGFGYLSHTWLSAEAQSRLGPATVVAAIAVEDDIAHRR